MQKLPEAPDRKESGAKKEPSWQKKEALSFLSAVTSWVISLKSFLLLVEGTMHPSSDVALANLFTSSSRLFN